MQNGQLFKRNGSWHLRFYRDEIAEGQPVWKRLCKRIAPIDDLHRSQKDVWPLVDQVLAPLNHGATPEGAMTFGAFYEKIFLPHVAARRVGQACFSFLPLGNAFGWPILSAVCAERVGLLT
jgi:hypothetical protein